MDQRARAREAASRRTGGAKRPAAGQVAKTNDQFAFFSESADGLKVSPKAVLIFSLFFIGSVVVLHIFGKVKQAAVG